MKKVVSLAVFGEGDKYSRYLPSFVLAHLNLFPQKEGWVLRIHLDDLQADSPHGRQLVQWIAQGLVEVHVMGHAILTKAMLWRMAPVFDPSVDYVFCRDLDCCPMPRDRAVMEQFIASKATVHTVHDNVLHGGMMGGLCGFHAPTWRSATGISSLEHLYAFADGANWTAHGTDQQVLNNLCLRPGGPVLLEHRFNGWHTGPGTQEKRPPQSYTCPAYSAPIPDEGWLWRSTELTRRADLLANHLGAAGFDHEAAVAFYREYGDPEIARRVMNEHPPGGPLMKYAYNKYSQNGEDGVLEEVWRRLEFKKRTFVEFGAGDGQTLSNTLKLAEEGWHGFWVEADPKSYQKALERAQQFEGRVKVWNVLLMATGDNSIDSLLSRHGYEDIRHIDFMSIDIDSFDLEIFEGLQRRPLVVLVEINSTVPIGVYQRHGNGKEGASFASMVEVARKKGYTLICHTGNLLFIRDDYFHFLKLPPVNHEMLFNDAWVRGAAGK